MAPFSISRTTPIAAAPDAVHALINDFHAWPRWSPWEGVDSNLQRSYSGPESGNGAAYAWQGDKNAGRGNMTITGSTPERIDIDLHFEKPWKAHNRVRFDVVGTPQGQTEATWTMSGENRGIAALFAKVFNMDKMLGKDFEKGLAQLKVAAENDGRDPS
ncbi:SRPBCC family protein [Naumannella sp. ID2617S]|nr:SRPBCC family protein [Naumannella sp. ID2617S]